MSVEDKYLLKVLLWHGWTRGGKNESFVAETT
jgi:hypothetical protein